MTFSNGICKMCGIHDENVEHLLYTLAKNGVRTRCLSATGDCTTANDVILQTVPIPKVTLWRHDKTKQNTAVSSRRPSVSSRRPLQVGSLFGGWFGECKVVPGPEGPYGMAGLQGACPQEKIFWCRRHLVDRRLVSP